MKNAKFCNRFFNIPLSQVCIPGLHIKLGVVVKFVKMFELFAIGVDFKIDIKKPMINDSSITIKDVDKNVHAQAKIYEIEDRKNIVLDEMNWCPISQESKFDEDGYKLLLEDVDHEITSEKVQFDILKKTINKEIKHCWTMLKVN